MARFDFVILRLLKEGKNIINANSDSLFSVVSQTVHCRKLRGTIAKPDSEDN